ncbi:MAG: DUF1080 domain-containing protein [Fibrobacteria bacterium]
MISVLLVSAAAGLALAAQPVISIPVTNAPCQEGPKMNGAFPDTVSAQPDSEGFVSIFNGTDLTGWWEDCQAHTTEKKFGGIWIVDPSQQILYSKEDGGNGNILVTNKKYDNYEIVLDVWPVFGNDGGVFNRTTVTGSNWQSGMDYVENSSVGGSYNENSWRTDTLNDDPFKFGTTPSNPTVYTWTSFTKDQNPTSFGCSAGGCVASDFSKVWDLDGWNQFRVKFYDGLTVGRSVTMELFFRKSGAANWVPTYKRSVARVTPAGPIALQVHGAGLWKPGAFNLYRNIKIRPLQLDGTPFPGPTIRIASPQHPTARPKLGLSQGNLIGEFDEEYAIILADARGRTLEKLSCSKGAFSHAVKAPGRGVLIVELRNQSGAVFHYRLSRI